MWIFKDRRELIKNYEGLKKEMRFAHSDRVKAQRETQALRDEVSKLQQENYLLKEQANNEKQKRIELADKLREQAEADLLVNALKACGVIKAEKKQDYFAEADRLNALRDYAMRQGAQSSGGYRQSDFLGLGLSAIMGGPAR